MYYFLLLLPVCLLVLWAKILADLRLTQRLLFRLLQGQLTPSELGGIDSLVHSRIRPLTGAVWPI